MEKSISKDLATDPHCMRRSRKSQVVATNNDSELEIVDRLVSSDAVSDDPLQAVSRDGKPCNVRTSSEIRGRFFPNRDN